MPVQLQLVFNRYDEIRNELKIIKKTITDQLDNSPEYIRVTNEIKELKQKQKEIVESVTKEYGDKLGDLKIDLDSEKELLSDVAINNLMKGEITKVEDKYGNELVPIFSVRFVKEN